GARLIRAAASHCYQSSRLGNTHRFGPPPAHRSFVHGHELYCARVSCGNSHSQPFSLKTRVSMLPSRCWSRYVLFRCQRGAAKRPDLKTRRIHLDYLASRRQSLAPQTKGCTDSTDETDATDRSSVRTNSTRNEPGRTFVNDLGERLTELQPEMP